VLVRVRVHVHVHVHAHVHVHVYMHVELAPWAQAMDPKDTLERLQHPPRGSITSVPMTFQSLLSFWRILWQLGWRDIHMRYKGSFLGLFWSLLTPVLNVVLYTFLFSVVFKSQWGEEFSPVGVSSNGGSVGSGASAAHSQYAIILFTGLILHAFLSDILVRSCLVVTQQANLVKKVVFPLHVLPAVVVFASVFQLVVSTGVLLAGLWVLGADLHGAMITLPIICLPLVIMSLGLSWVLASLGVYLRDLGQIMGWFVTALMFSAPILYPLKTISASWGPWLYLNPLTFVVEEVRHVIFAGTWPHWSGWLTYLLISLVVAVLGAKFFDWTQEGFADVL
jgi:lipopolysaccharide transport system permease protein